MVFTPDGRYPFLRKAFFKMPGKIANASLVEDPPGHKFMCAFCVFILMAKFKGAYFKSSKKTSVIFKDEEEQLSWLNTLGVDKDELEAFMTKCFDGFHFFSASRGTSGKVPASASFNREALKLGNVNLFRPGPKSSRVRLKHSQLRELAEQLEQYATGRKHLAWEATVKTQADEIEAHGSAISEGELEDIDEETVAEMEGCRISPLWKQLFDESLTAIEKRKLGGDWYIVCGTPIWMLPWGRHFFAAVKQGGTVRLAHHAASAPEQCPSVAAQWKMNIEHLGVPDPIGHLQKRMKDCAAQLASWDQDARKQKAKGKFEFYESFIGHPYVAILIVPKPSKKVDLEDHPAPEGTQCLLGMQTFYPRSLEKRVGLHFYEPSPSLDNYYNSIRRLFLQGPSPGENYLKRIDHLAILRSDKGTV